MPESSQKIETLAQDVMNLSRNTLVINLRFMDKAISMLKLQRIQGIAGCIVDGQSIYFDPVYVLKQYSKDNKYMVRQYLHMVLHCVYKHFWVSTLVNREYWDLACDIAVEYTINDIDINATSAESIVSRQTKEIKKLKEKVKYMTADMLYKYFMTSFPPEERINELKQLFSSDLHDIWYSPKKIEALQSETETNSLKESYKVGNGNIIKEWGDIARQMRMDIESFSKSKGNVSGGLTQNLLAVTRERYDYSSFLKRFAVLGERMKINPDEFDYVFYTYGLRLYEKMPLIEPLEYKEVKQIKEFVIAIDTSGSTSGELVQAFLQKTYNILKQEEGFFRRFTLHIIQCDAEIQEDKRITNQHEFDLYIANMKIRGLGGTDFRPVFKYVDELIEKKEFSNLKGMIYFTDGYGTFPTKQPNYNTAFVFVEEGYENPEVPIWAIKLVLQPDDIKEMQR